MKPWLLDLYCGAGGAAVGYHRAGFEVVGVDIKPQRNYPFEFVQMDALDALIRGYWSFDAIHASPPCQAYSDLRYTSNGKDYPELIPPTQELLRAIGLPYVIENVEGAPLRDPVVICGSSVGLDERRHRLFETNWPLMAPPCVHHGRRVIGVYGGGRAVRTSKRRGGYQGTAVERREAMGIDWMNWHELNQAIPPAYTELIGHQLMQHVTALSPEGRHARKS